MIHLNHPNYNYQWIDGNVGPVLLGPSQDVPNLKCFTKNFGTNSRTYFSFSSGESFAKAVQSKEMCLVMWKKTRKTKLSDKYMFIVDEVGRGDDVKISSKWKPHLYASVSLETFRNTSYHYVQLTKVKTTWTMRLVTLNAQLKFGTNRWTSNQDLSAMRSPSVKSSRSESGSTLCVQSGEYDSDDEESVKSQQGLKRFLLCY